MEKITDCLSSWCSKWCCCCCGCCKDCCKRKRRGYEELKEQEVSPLSLEEINMEDLILSTKELVQLYSKENIVLWIYDGEQRYHLEAKDGDVKSLINLHSSEIGIAGDVGNKLDLTKGQLISLRGVVRNAVVMREKGNNIVSALKERFSSASKLSSVPRYHSVEDRDIELQNLSEEVVKFLVEKNIVLQSETLAYQSGGSGVGMGSFLFKEQKERLVTSILLSEQQWKDLHKALCNKREVYAKKEKQIFY